VFDLHDRRNACAAALRARMDLGATVEPGDYRAFRRGKSPPKPVRRKWRFLVIPGLRVEYKPK
jgi:hypothetical protein